jgi:hypothetical protein
VMVEMIVETGQTKVIVTMNAQTTNLNAIVMDDVSLVHINVTEIRIVLTDLMKLTKFVITENATKKQNSPVKMENVFQSYGDVILITIVEMIVTNRLTYVATTTVLLVGVVVQVMLTIAVFLSGCSVMERMIVGMARMNLQKIVHHVRKRETSNAKTGDVFQNVGYVISKMTVVTTQTNPPIYVATMVIENVLNPNFDVTMLSVFQLVGNVTMMMIVETAKMNKIVKSTLVQQKDSNVIVVTVLRKSLNVTEIGTA